MAALPSSVLDDVAAFDDALGELERAVADVETDLAGVSAEYLEVRISIGDVCTIYAGQSIGASTSRSRGAVHTQLDAMDEDHMCWTESTGL